MELSPLPELIRNVQKFNNYLYCSIQYTKSEVWPSQALLRQILKDIIQFILL